MVERSGVRERQQLRSVLVAEGDHEVAEGFDAGHGHGIVNRRTTAAHRAMTGQGSEVLGFALASRNLW